MALDKVRIWERHNAQTELAGAIARVKNELAAPTLKTDEIFAPVATSHGDMRSRLLGTFPDGEIEEQVLLAQARDVRIPEEKARIERSGGQVWASLRDGPCTCMCSMCMCTHICM